LPAPKSMPLLQHLNELRRTVIIAVAAWIVATLLIFLFWGEQVFRWFTLPLDRLQLQLVIISPLEGFTVKMEACLFAGLVVALPLILFQLWRFIAPALYSREKRWLLIAFSFSLLLFLAGIAFGYLLFVGVALQFLLFTAGAGLQPMLVAGKYFSFLLAVLVPFGLAFQMPVVFWLLTRMGLVTHKKLQKSRRLAVVTILILAAIFTPTTDIVSLLLMAGPLYLLFEISVLIAYFSRPKTNKRDQESA